MTLTRTFDTRALLALTLLALLAPIIVLAQPLPKVVADGTKLEREVSGAKIVLTVDRLPDNTCKVNGTFRWGKVELYDWKNFGQGPCRASNLQSLLEALYLKVVTQGKIPPRILTTIVTPLVNQIAQMIGQLGG